jgi:hypothetical protein
VNKHDAHELLSRRIAELRPLPYRDLLSLLGNPQLTEAIGPSGALYAIEAETLWDDRPAGNLRVIVSIDDGGWSAFSPMTSDFIKGPDDRFVGE